jgi:hypothetical protein
MLNAFLQNVFSWNHVKYFSIFNIFCKILFSGNGGEGGGDRENGDETIMMMVKEEVMMRWQWC